MCKGSSKVPEIVVNDKGLYLIEACLASESCKKKLQISCRRFINVCDVPPKAQGSGKCLLLGPA